MTETATFVCSICGESSTDICVYCTKDTCTNHRCVRCLRCSDCCECEVPLTAASPQVEPSAPPIHAAPIPEPIYQPEPVLEAEPVAVRDAEKLAIPDAEPSPEVAGVAAIVLPEPTAVSTVEQATTPEELVRALPELFAPEPEEPAKPDASDTNAPQPEPESPEPESER